MMTIMDDPLMEPCRTPHILHLVFHMAQFWDLYSSCCTSTTSTKTSIRLFADDSIIYRKINSNIGHQILQTDLIQLEKWSDKWQMQSNISANTRIHYLDTRFLK